MDYKVRIRKDLRKIYSQDLLNNLFRHPYTKIEFVQNELGVTRKTAARYLELLEENGYLKKIRIGRSGYFLNEKLLALLASRNIDFDGAESAERS
jgi:Fic family protein